jgi:hypothetical protein
MKQTYLWDINRRQSDSARPKDRGNNKKILQIKRQWMVVEVAFGSKCSV